MIDLQDILPDIVDRVVTYFYSLDYDDKHPQDTKHPMMGRLMINAQVYLAGDRFIIPELKQLAIEKSLHYLQSLGSSLAWRIYLSYIIKIVWKSTPATDKGLRMVYLEEFLRRRKEIKETEGQSRIYIMKNLRAVPDFFEEAIFTEKA